MKKQFIILFTILSASLIVNAQKEYRVVKSSGQLKLNINGAIVEGYDGKEIIFTSQTSNTEEDDRAKGLVAISGSGVTDNTGMGINVTENGAEVNVVMVSRRPTDKIIIKVPQNIKVSFNYKSTFYHEEIFLKNLKGEIEVSASYNKIKLENNTGPMNIKTVYGSVEASFNTEIKGPISIISVYDYVDVTLPSSTKANIELGTNYGKLYAGKEFKIDFEKLDPEKYVSNLRLTGNRIENRPLNATKQANKEVVVTAYPTGTLTITKENTKGKDTINIQRGTFTGTKINGNGTTNQIMSDVATTVTGVQINETGSIWGSGGDKIKGKLNGGGIDLIFKSTYNNVYLRQQ